MKLEKILDAWWHSETLLPGEMPKLNLLLSNKFNKQKQALKKFQKIYNGTVKIPNEWQNIQLKDNAKRNIGLYGCCYKEHELIEFQRDYYKVKDDIHNKSMKKCYGFYVGFDESNKYIKDSLFIPHVNLYIKLAQNGQKTFDESFFDIYRESMQYLNGQAESINDGVFSTDWLSNFLSEFQNNFAIPSSSKEMDHYLELIIVSDETNQHRKFNSFYSEDILKAKEDMNATIRQFLSKSINRIDINENRNFIEKHLYPLNIPMGRWPSQVDHRLTLMQQVAINEFFLTPNTISSVNGPPGTGKTTLLKDIFAEIVVKKALAMITFRDNPSKALISTNYKVNIKNRSSEEKEIVTRIVYNIDPTIAQYAAVVTSSNNTAVENISRDLPKSIEIHEHFKDELKPLAYASGVSKKITGEAAWGMFSIPLGKGDNIKNAASLLTGEDFSVLNSLKFSSGNKSKRKIEWEKACDEFEVLYEEIKTMRQQLADAVDYRNVHIEDDEDFISSTDLFWANTPEQYKNRQKKVLYQTHTLNEKRSVLFLKALAVLRHFLSMNIGKIEAALSLLEKRNEIDMNNMDAIEATKAMWNTVHCICPVISTTFASFSSMYRGMPKDFIPYLFIDEAGQATPSQAVGALWRSKKVLVVGDPLQIEPVQTLHPSVIEDIRKIYRIDEELFNIKSSVQTIADRANQYGSYVSPEQWIGIPLWVHRRCIEPMFSISNELAYNGKMVLSKNEIGVGEWLQCQGQVSKEQYVPNQKDKLISHIKEHMVKILKLQLLNAIKDKLENGESIRQIFRIFEENEEMDTTWSIKKKQCYKLMGKYLELRQRRTSFEILDELQQMENQKFSCPKIYVITPFSTVKNELKNDIKSGLFFKMYEWLNKSINVDGYDEAANKLENTLKVEARKFQEWYLKWLDKNIGTVHTFQGKEADIVYFVTGTDISKKMAAEWACKEPNLLNVAVTRAKKEFYIIGDQEILEEFVNYKKIIDIMNEFRERKNIFAKLN